MKHVVIELLPGRVDIVVFHGSRRVAARRLPFPEPKASEWPAAVRAATEPIKAAVDELNAGGMHGSVIFRSPTLAVDLVSYQIASAANAVEAACLNFTEALPYPARLAACEGVMAGRDPRGTGRRTHVIVAAEREDCADAMVGLIEACGLRLQSVTPRDAAVLARLVARARRRRLEARGWLYVGEHASFLLVVERGAIRYSRRIDVGIETIARGLVRTTGAPDESDLEASLDAARLMLMERGVPKPDERPDHEMEPERSEMLLSLQPVLQRYMLELRQSLRFGVDDKTRQSLQMLVTGPGATLPGLDELIRVEVDVAVERDTTYDRYAWDEPGSAASELMDALRMPRVITRMSLMPAAMATKNRQVRLRNWMWTGAAAAMIVIGFDTFRYQARLGSARDQVSTSAAHLADLDALEDAQKRLRTALDAMTDLETEIATETASNIDFRSCLKELSVVTPESIRFTGMMFEASGSGLRANVSGYAFTDVASPRTALETFIAGLETSPLFDEVVLGNVHRGTVGEREGHRFEASFGIVDVPLDHAETIVAAAAKEAGE